MVPVLHRKEGVIVFNVIAELEDATVKALSTFGYDDVTSGSHPSTMLRSSRELAVFVATKAKTMDAESEFYRL